MKKETGTPIKLSNSFRDFVENIRTTRRSKVVGVDKKMKNLTETCDLFVNYFKAKPQIFQDFIKFKEENNVR